MILLVQYPPSITSASLGPRQVPVTHSSAVSLMPWTLLVLTPFLLLQGCLPSSPSCSHSAPAPASCSPWALPLLVGVCVIGSQNSKFQRDLVALNNSTSHTEDQVKSLMSQGDSLQKLITPLRAEVGNHKQELEAARSTNDKVFSLEKKLEKEQQELKAESTPRAPSPLPVCVCPRLFRILLLVQQQAEDLKFLACQRAALKSNGPAAPRTGWSTKSWPEAEKNCRLQNAHLVVINSREEQNFVQEHIASSDTWMGLSDPEGVWKWVDGTDYKTNFHSAPQDLTHSPFSDLDSVPPDLPSLPLSSLLRNWSPGQPDDWDGHGLGGGEDCAHFCPDGQWNDIVCQSLLPWVCETKLDKAS
ncbi:hypothetical protein HPG69_015780 [Diceros bicornis minor]|uniref:C-type lectin domain-containing protein n=1 Tax=Diceros bicornis minor TaxID=77932 RepID=A0A7J7E7M3_DICBM|nr:hypothetical protein HPG69_015780 [Diceros bicornis minor]